MTSRTSVAMRRSSSGSGPTTRNSDGEGRTRTEHQLRHPHASLRRKPVGHRLSQSQLECLARLFARGQDDDLRERGIRQLRGHGEIEARRALPDVGGHDPASGCLASHVLDLGGGGTRLLDRSASAASALRPAPPADRKSERTASSPAPMPNTATTGRADHARPRPAICGE